MIKFNVLGIYDDKLVIDVSVKNLPYYTDVYLDKIIIDNQDTYVSTGPSVDPVYEFTIPDIEFSEYEEPSSRKDYRLELDETDLNSLNDLFFVYVTTKGYPSPDTPCGMDNGITLGVTVNMRPFYLQAMRHAKKTAISCADTKEFSDYILKLKAFELSIKTGNYVQAVQYFNKFFRNTSNFSIGGCSCGNN